MRRRQDGTPIDYPSERAAPAAARDFSGEVARGGMAPRTISRAQPEQPRPDLPGLPTPEQAVGGTQDASVVNVAGQTDSVETDPTEGQKEAGNYKKAHVQLGGLDLSIENPKGSTRSGKAPDGTEWSVTMPEHYGYVRRTEGADGDQVDVYVADDDAADPTGPVFVVDQFDADTGRWDEHKAFIGFSDDLERVQETYDAAFDDGRGPERRKGIKRMTFDEFKTWLREGDTTKPVMPVEEEGQAQEEAAPEAPRWWTALTRVGKRQAAERAGFTETQAQTVSGTDWQHMAPEIRNSLNEAQRAEEAPAPPKRPKVTPQTEAMPGMTPLGVPERKEQMPDLRESMPSAVKGDEVEMRTEDGEYHKVRLEIIDADDLIPSNDAYGNRNPDYPQDFQPRDRKTAEAVEQMQSVANRPNPPELGNTGHAGIGAPVVLPGGVVLSGNGRSAGIKLAYQDPDRDPSDYRRWVVQQAQAFGIPRQRVQAIKNPVLVRVWDKKDATRKEIMDFAKVANRGVTLESPASERAANDAELIPDEMMVEYIPDEDGNPLASTNREWLRKFSELTGARHVTKEGGWSGQMRTRVENAVFVKAYGGELGSQLIAKKTEEPTPDGKKVLSALQRAAPAFARAQALGTDPALDAVTPVLEAINLMERAANDRVDISAITSQSAMFGTGASAQGKRIAHLLSDSRVQAGDQRATRMKNSAVKMGNAFTRMAQRVAQAIESERGGTLLQPLPKPTLDEVIDYGFQVEPEGGAAPAGDAQGLVLTGGSGRDTPPAPSANTGGGLFASSQPKREEPDLDQKFEDAMRAKLETIMARERQEATPPPAPPPENETPQQRAERERDEAREAFKAALNRTGGTVYTGVDPELLMLGARYAFAEMKLGAHKFADFAKAAMDSIGEQVLPYLRDIYEAAREIDPPWIDEMSTPEEIDAWHEQREANEGGERRSDDVRATPDREEPAGGEAAAEERGVGGGDGVGGEQRTEAEGDADNRGRSGGRRTGGRTSPRAPRRTGKSGTPSERATGVAAGENWHFAPGTLLDTEKRGPKQKAQDNVAAIELRNMLKAEGRQASPEEQAALARYVGWGQLDGAFPDENGHFRKGYAEIGHKLKDILAESEYRTAKQSIQYAHYTSEQVIDFMWQAAERLGFEGGSILEPGMGVGHFPGLMPGAVAHAPTTYTGIEMDGVSADISSLLYPKWGVRHEGFERSKLPADHYDLAIGNPPFGDISLNDPAYNRHKFRIHDYFFAKSLDSVRPGGMLAFVSSAGTLNKMGDKARRYMADRADLVGAVRLPNTAFKQNAGTEVTTDIVFLRKRLADETPGDDSWVGTG
ncbi:MAG: hypothetical protein OXG44_17530, partial [Gammaproteobacteria bacterium]|nr:hypothetical protein [Gammaproteobacteria bacterium]